MIAMNGLMPQTPMVFIDVETTRLQDSQAGKRRIIEIALAVTQGFRVVETFSTLINPMCAMDPAASNVNGITQQMVDDAPLFGDVAEYVAWLLQQGVTVAHNACFDTGCIKAELPHAMIPQVPVIDTMWLARLQFKFTSNRLVDIAKQYGLKHQAHTALGDVAVTLGALQHMMLDIDPDSQLTLQGVLDMHANRLQSWE